MLVLTLSVRSITFLACVVAASTTATAQCLRWESDFGFAGMSNPVHAFAVLDDGSGPALYAGGTFVTAGTTPVNRIARWRDGAWEDLDRGVGGSGLPSVQAFAGFDDGSGPALYIGGSFSVAGSAPAKGVARWNGTTWSAVGGGIDVGSVSALAVFDDGQGPALYAGGAITVADGNPVSNIVRWDGTSWTSLATGVHGGSVRALAVFDDGQGPALYAGGFFTSASGVPASRIARWDGVSWSALGVGVSAGVEELLTYDDGSGTKLLVGGQFAQAGGQTANGVATWDGSAWAPLGAGVAPFAQVHALTLHDDGRGVALYAGGLFSGGNFARWDGASWTPLASGVDGLVNTLASFDSGSGGELFAGGTFTASGTTALSRIAAWDGDDWSPLGDPGTTQGALGTAVLALAAFDDGSGPALYASGNITAVGDVVATNARWDGSTWSALPNFGTADVLRVLDVGGGPRLYAGTSSSVRQWDGAAWSLVGSMDAAVHALAVFDPTVGGPALYAGGSFHLAGGVLVNGIARFTGTGWAPLGTGVGGDVLALERFDVGNGPRLYAAGTFSTTPSQYVAAWDGTTWSSVGGTNGPVLALRVFDDGSGLALYAGGAFTIAGGVPVRNVARFDGSSWSAVGTGLDAIVNALTLFDDGSGPALYAGGSFNVSPTCPAARVARWNGSAWSGLGSGLDGTVRALASFDDGKGPSLFAGGTFLHAGLEGSLNIAQWRGCTGPIELFCFGDGSLRPCPCANEGAFQHGCENSASTGGARLFVAGTTTPDTLFLQASGELPSALSIFLQGNQLLTSGASFGDGVRCAGGNLVRLFVKNANTGVVSAPQAGDPSIGTQSAALGDTIAPGSTRYYQVYYRDPSATFCPPPQGDGWNATNGARVVW